MDVLGLVSNGAEQGLCCGAVVLLVKASPMAQLWGAEWVGVGVG